VCCKSFPPCTLIGPNVDSTLQPPSQSSFITAHELSEIRKRVIRISTGSKQLDAMVGGFVLLPLILVML
jgi:Rad51